MTEQPEPLEVLAFIESGMSMTTEQISSRWPEWHARLTRARQRYEDECRAYRTRWGQQANGCSDPMVSSYQDAVFHWVYLPLIRTALAKEDGRS